MHPIEQQRVLPATPTQVWALLSALNRLAEWATDVDHSTYLTHQTEGVGTKRRVQVGQSTLVETMTVWEPELALAYTIEGLPSFVPPLTNTWSLQELDSGTQVTLTTSVGGGSHTVMRALGRRLSKTSTMLMDGLAAAVSSHDVSD